MKKNHLVSVIVPIYNAELFLDKSIPSIMNQTYDNIEIILINDGSSDNSLEIINKYAKKDKRIIVIDKQNEGVSITRNKGIGLSTGEYITFVDADDALISTAIEERVSALEKYNVSLVLSNYSVIYSDTLKEYSGNLNGIANKKFNSKDIIEKIIPKILDGSLASFVHCILAKKELIEKTNLFTSDIHMMEDTIFYIDMLTKTTDIYVLDKKLYIIEFNPESATNSSKNYYRNIFNVIAVNYYIKDILKKNDLLTEDNIICLNTANAIAISDFIFRHYLAGYETINLCKELAKNENFINILVSTNENKINLQRRYILKYIRKNNMFLLKIFLIVRKCLRKFKS